MEKTENKEVTTSRDRIRDRFVQKYPERDFNGENASNDLDDLIVSELEAYDKELEESRAQNKKMVDLFNRDPRSAGLLMDMAAGGDPITYLLTAFGPELMDALQSEEGRAKISESTSKYLERKASEEAGEQERMANYEKSIQDLAAYAEEKGLSDEQAIKIFEKVNQVGFDVIEGIYTRETFDMAYNAMNYTADVETARKEGEVAGRNAKIEEKLAKVEKPVDMPPAVGGQASSVAETRPKPNRSNMFGV